MPWIFNANRISNRACEVRRLLPKIAPASGGGTGRSAGGCAAAAPPRPRLRPPARRVGPVPSGLADVVSCRGAPAAYGPRTARLRRRRAPPERRTENALPVDRWGMGAPEHLPGNCRPQAGRSPWKEAQTEVSSRYFANSLPFSRRRSHPRDTGRPVPDQPSAHVRRAEDGRARRPSPAMPQVDLRCGASPVHGTLPYRPSPRGAAPPLCPTPSGRERGHDATQPQSTGDFRTGHRM